MIKSKDKNLKKDKGNKKESKVEEFKESHKGDQNDTRSKESPDNGVKDLNSKKKGVRFHK